ncbi:MAG: hypothetical protein AAFU79_32495, partial [Myxococcota bacterium]
SRSGRPQRHADDLERAGNTLQLSWCGEERAGGWIRLGLRADEPGPVGSAGRCRSSRGPRTSGGARNERSTGCP